jgi:hypothetical protein
VFALVLSILSLAVAIGSVILVFAIERAKRPRVAIELGQQHWSSPSPFAHVAVLNTRPTGWLGRHFGGVTVMNCRASIEFLKGKVSVLGPLDARWSGAPEPNTPSEYPLSYRWDLAATGQPEQIAVARTGDGVAHAFSAESYSYENWQKPEWLLDPGEYKVVVRLAATEVEASEIFRLIVASNGRLTLATHDGAASI